MTNQTDTETPTAQTVDITPETESEAVKLGDIYDQCLLGATVRGKYAYSLKKLVARESFLRRVPVDKAREALGEQIVDILREHGSNAPEFIDDELMEEAKVIVIP